jgi:hypothetical protein
MINSKSTLQIIDALKSGDYNMATATKVQNKTGFVKALTS